MSYPYKDLPRQDILRIIPEDGKVIGTIGCGYGATEAELVKAGRIVHGADIAPEVAAVAASRLTTFHLLSPSEGLPWEENSLDGLILADVLEHIPLGWEKLALWTRCLKPSAWVVISVPNMRGIDVIIEFILKGDWPEKDIGIFDRTHVNVMSHKRLSRWCKTAGLQIERFHDMYDPNGPRRQRFFRFADLLTLRLFHTWFMYHVQCVCRKQMRPI